MDKLEESLKDKNMFIKCYNSIKSCETPEHFTNVFKWINEVYNMECLKTSKYNANNTSLNFGVVFGNKQALLTICIEEAKNKLGMDIPESLEKFFNENNTYPLNTIMV